MGCCVKVCNLNGDFPNNLPQLISSYNLELIKLITEPESINKFKL